MAARDYLFKVMRKHFPLEKRDSFYVLKDKLDGLDVLLSFGINELTITFWEKDVELNAVIYVERWPKYNEVIVDGLVASGLSRKIKKTVKKLFKKIVKAFKEEGAVIEESFRAFKGGRIAEVSYVDDIEEEKDLTLVEKIVL